VRAKIFPETGPLIMAEKKNNLSLVSSWRWVVEGSVVVSILVPAGKTCQEHFPRTINLTDSHILYVAKAFQDLRPLLRGNNATMWSSSQPASFLVAKLRR